MSAVARALASALNALAKKFCIGRGTTVWAAHYGNVTAETPPPVQAAGDTIPKASAQRAEAFFFLAGAAQEFSWLRNRVAQAQRTARGLRTPARQHRGELRRDRRASRTPRPFRRFRAGCPRASRSRTRCADASGPSMSTSSASAQPSSRSARWTSSTIASAGPCLERLHGAGDARAHHDLAGAGLAQRFLERHALDRIVLDHEHAARAWPGAFRCRRWRNSCGSCQSLAGRQFARSSQRPQR